MNNGKTECTFLWSIENYSYCCHKNGEQLISPEFPADSLEDETWNVHLYPRGHDDKSKGYISLFLNRSKDGAGPKNVSVKYELSVLRADGKAPHSQEYKYTFQKGGGYGTVQFLQMEEVLLRRKTEYLPQDTLSVRCKVWYGEGKIKQRAEIHARTRIGIEQISFLHVVERFSTLEPNQKKTAWIRFRSKKRPISSSVYFSDSLCCDQKVMVHITSSDNNHILYKCKLALLGTSRQKIECGKIDNGLDATGKIIQILPLSITRQDILSKRSEYLPDDELSLSCECSFSTGVKYNIIERIIYEKSFLSLTKDRYYENNIAKYMFVVIFSCFFGVFVSYLWG